MKIIKMAKKAERLTILIIFLSIISLCIFSLLPIIKIQENDFVKDDLHFNYEMMKKSSNEKINNLADDLSLINILFWILITLGLLSNIGATLNASKKYLKAGDILLSLGLITLIVSILIINYIYIFLKNIGESDIYSASVIYPPFDYAYISLIPSVIILICSVSYTWSFSVYSIRKLKVARETKKDERKLPEEPIKKIMKTKEIERTKIKKQDVKKIQIEPEIDVKRVEMEQWLTDKVKEKEKPVIVEEVVEQKKETEPESIVIPKQIFPEEKIPIVEDKSEETEEVPVHQSFEEALSSAIQKKQNEIKKQKPLHIEETKEKMEDLHLDQSSEAQIDENSEIVNQPKIEPITKRVNVRCPRCKHIFSVEKEHKITKIKCPKCGKEGNIQ